MDDGMYLADRATKNTVTAIRLDSQGSKMLAIEYYQRACNDLYALTIIYRNNFHAVKLWMERANAYQNRIRALKAKRRSDLRLILGIAVAAITLQDPL